MTILQRLAATGAPAAVILIRLMVGAVFLSEGLQKFLLPGDPDRGAARFAKLGFPAPEFVGSFVASFEIACGILIILGFLTRLAVIPTLSLIVVATMTTEVTVLLAHGFWDITHAGRTDFSMPLGSLFLLWKGAGPWSLDARLPWSR